MDCFEHAPLPTDAHHIRLLKFESRPVEHPDDPLRLSLEVMKSSTEPNFNALSYEWGRTEADQPILVNGRRFLIRENLHRFLQVLNRSEQRSTRIFTDAICINQDDLTERNAQVQAIGRVYSRAAKVLVWLGPATTESNFVFDLCSAAASESVDETAAKDRISKIDPNQEEGDALDTIYQRSYWTRLWVIQELFLAQDAIVFCGEKATSWSVLRRLPRSTKGHFVQGGWSGMTIALGSTAGGRQARSILSMLDKKDSQSSSLYNLLLKFGQAQCLDVRDRVFGLLGFADAGQQEGDQAPQVVVDYALSPAELFVQVLRTCPRELRVKSARDIFHILQLHHNDLTDSAEHSSFMRSIPEDINFRVEYSHIGSLKAFETTESHDGVQLWVLSYGRRQRSMASHGVGPLNHLGPNNSILASDTAIAHEGDDVFLLEGTNLVAIRHTGKAARKTKKSPSGDEMLEPGAKYERGVLWHSERQLGEEERGLLEASIRNLPTLPDTDGCQVAFRERYCHVAHEMWNLRQVVWAVAHLGQRTEYWDRLE